MTCKRKFMGSPAPRVLSAAHRSFTAHDNSPCNNISSRPAAFYLHKSVDYTHPSIRLFWRAERNSSGIAAEIKLLLKMHIQCFLCLNLNCRSNSDLYLSFSARTIITNSIVCSIILLPVIYCIMQALHNICVCVCLLLLATLSVTLLLIFYADGMIFALSFWVIYLQCTTCSE